MTLVAVPIRFAWDPEKASANLRKHGVTFDEAQTIFFDDHARLIDDPEHSGFEDRFVMLGLSAKLRMLVVCHCYRDENSTIRLISARKASKTEAKEYRRLEP
jgi:uncharacterized protein